MGYRHQGKTEHEARRLWDKWKQANAALLAHCGLPPGVLRSRRDWDYLLRYGYWCDEAYGRDINKIDFDLSELTPAQTAALRQLLTATLNDEQKQHGCAAWHHVCPPGV